MAEDVRMKVSKGRRVYNRGADRTEGEFIYVSPKEARLIKALGRAELAPEHRPLRVAEPQPAARVLRQSSMLVEEQTPPATDATPSPTTRRRYRRSDMQSED